MPALPLPPGDNQLGVGDYPVSSIVDVQAILPAFLLSSDPTPIRDGLLAGLTAALLAYQERVGYAAAQSDILRATGSYLVGLGQDRQFFQQATESDADYRARILAIPNLVTPAAILAAVNAILAPFSTVLAQYFDSVHDRWFVRSGSPTTGFHSFVYQSGFVNLPSPYYPNRLYLDDSIENGGIVRPQSNPGGARAFNDTVGREFVLRIPDLSAITSEIVAAYETSENVPYPEPTIQPGAGMFAYRTHPGSAFGAYLRTRSATATDIYQAIVNTVERLRAHSIRWILQVDPTLVAV